MRAMAAALLLVLGSQALVEAQDARKFGKEIAKEEQKQIDEAIRKGIAFLKTQARDLSGYAFKEMPPDELVLWTFVHAGVPETDPDFRLLFDRMMESPLKLTYGVSLQALSPPRDASADRRRERRPRPAEVTVTDRTCRRSPPME